MHSKGVGELGVRGAFVGGCSGPADVGSVPLPGVGFWSNVGDTLVGPLPVGDAIVGLLS